MMRRRWFRSYRAAPTVLVVMAGVAGGVRALSQSAPALDAATRPASQATASAPGAASDLDGQLATAERLIRGEQYQPAIDLLQPIVAAHPDLGRAHMWLGGAYHKSRRYSPAKVHLQRAVELMPSHYPIHMILGFCLYYLGEGDAARRSFEIYLEHAPNEGHAHFGIGLIELDSDHLAEAEQRFKRAIDLHAAAKKAPLEGSAHARLGDVYIRQEKFAEAKEELQAAARLDPNAYQAWFKLARVLTRLGDSDGAKEAMQQHDKIKARIRPPEGFPE